MTDPISLRTNAHIDLIKACDTRKESAENIRIKIDEILSSENFKELSSDEKTRLSPIIFREATGYGVIDELIADSDVTEILVLGAHHVFKRKKDNKFRLHPEVISNDNLLRNIISKMATKAEARIDELSPMLSCSLSAVGKVTGVIEPISKMPAIRIQKNPRAADAPPVKVIHSKNAGQAEDALENCHHDNFIISVEAHPDISIGNVCGLALYTRVADADGAKEVLKKDLLKFAMEFEPDVLITI